MPRLQALATQLRRQKVRRARCAAEWLPAPNPATHLLPAVRLARAISQLPLVVAQIRNPSIGALRHPASRSRPQIGERRQPRCTVNARIVSRQTTSSSVQRHHRWWQSCAGRWPASRLLSSPPTERSSSYSSACAGCCRRRWPRSSTRASSPGDSALERPDIATHR